MLSSCHKEKVNMRSVKEQIDFFENIFNDENLSSESKSQIEALIRDFKAKREELEISYL